MEPSLARSCATVSLFLALSGLLIGEGRLVGVACVLAGTALSCLLWRKTAGRDGDLLTHTGRLGCVVVGGFALFATVAWLAWAVGLPINFVHEVDSNMDRAYWMGPAAIVYAAVCYGVWEHL